MKPLTVALATIAFLTASGIAAAQEKYEEKSPREWKYEFQRGNRVLKEERKGREYKYEAKRGGDERKFERKADGGWIEEIKQGGCTIKRERAADGEYKEDRSC